MKIKGFWLKQVTVGDDKKIIRLSTPLEFHVDSSAGLYVITHEDLGLMAADKIFKNVVEEIKEEISELWKDFVDRPESELSEKSKEFKTKLLDYLKE